MSSGTIQQRPGLVTAVAVLNFIFGGLGLLWALCVGTIIGVVAAVWQNLPAPKQGEPDPKELFKLVLDVPGYVPFVIASVAVGLIMSVVLIVSGFGLLKLRNWARYACFVYAVYSILSVIGTQVYTHAVVEPAMQKNMAQFMEKMKKQGAQVPPQQQQNPMGQAGGMVGGVVGSLFSIAYAVALLVILNLPDVKRAFATGGLVTRTDDRVADEWDRGVDRDRPYGDEGRGRLRSDDDRIAPGEP
jgi:hypothetical protein